MLAMFDNLRDISFLSTAIRMLMAVACGGLIGVEREYKRRSAGFRTHILVCLGASMTTLTSQYLYLSMHYYTDMARLGAQVVAGIGFIGAGSIIVTPKQRVKGLTTAAGLWVAAIIGLAIGGGFYEGGLIVTALVLLAEMLFSKWEYRILERAPEINLYMEYESRESLEAVLKTFREREVKVLNMEVTRSDGAGPAKTCVIFTLRLNKKCLTDKLLTIINSTNGVLLVEEL